MQAKRKAIDPAKPRGDAPGEAEGWAPSSDASTVSPQSSPAHLMLRGLSARLTEAAPESAAVALPAERKWPMPKRLGAIAGLSLLGWGGLYVVALALL